MMFDVGGFDNLFRRHVSQLYYFSNVFILVTGGEQDFARIKLEKNATVGPHVDGMRVALDIQNYLRSPVKTGLNVGVDLLTNISTRAEIDNFNTCLTFLAYQNIFRFQITMDNTMFKHEVETYQDLYGKPFNKL